MTRYEKIQFIRKSRLFSFAYLNLDGTTDDDLDQMIRHIVGMLQKHEVAITGNRVREFYFFLN
ncbi:MAG: hypothetical protein ACHQF2_07590 [Flavobacteriales bacterium]